MVKTYKTADSPVQRHELSCTLAPLELSVRVSPLLSAAAATALLAALAGPASAATTPAPGVGTALSAGSLTKLSAAGQVLEALRLQLPTGTVDGNQALVRIVPLLSDGKEVGQAVEVGSGQEKSFASQSAGLPGVLSLTSPGGSLSALIGPNGPVATATTTGLGGLKLLGSDVLGDGSFATTSQVTKVGSSATKGLALDGLALPKLLDLLTNLGLDLSSLPIGSLTDLLGGLNLLNPAGLVQLNDLVSLLDITNVGGLLAVGPLDALPGNLDAAQIGSLLDLTNASASQADAVTSLLGQIGALSPATANSQQSSAQALPDVSGIVADLTGGAGTDLTGGTLDPVLSLLDQGTITGLEGLLGNGSLAPADLLGSLQGVLDELVGGLLDDLLGNLADPADLLGLLNVSLLKVGKLDVSTLATSGDTDAADVTGTLAGVDVLGTDVLSSVLGKDSVDLTSLLGNNGAGLGSLTDTVNGLLGTVTSVLGGAGIALPLPEVAFLKNVEETLTASNGTKTSRAGVEALSLTWALDELNIPAVSSLTDSLIKGGSPVGGLPLVGNLPLGANSASALPTGQLTGLLSNGQLTDLLSEPLSLVLGDLTDTAVFTAAGSVPPAVVPVAAPPVTAAPVGTQLPRTGASSAIAALGIALMGGAIFARRRRMAAGDVIG